MVRIHCPSCDSELEVRKEDHYKMLECPICGRHFQALRKGTMGVALDFLDELKKKGYSDGEDPGSKS